MNYKQTLDFLFSQLPMYQRQGQAAYKADLDNTLKLDAYFNHPHKNFKTIHVAGTNGKGSVSHMIASVLQEAGFKTGLYTSPHLIDFRERIKINGEKIPETEVVSFVEKHKAIINDIKPSFFEMTVAMAFDFFARKNVHIAVIETGMGGRLDSTNIIHPMLSIITNIDLDHTQFLGTTRKEIAAEKAGIIKENVPVIVGEPSLEIEQIFADKAASSQSPICFAPRRFTVNKHTFNDNEQQLLLKNIQSGTSWDLSLDLLGAYQKNNIITVMAAMQILIPQLKIPKECVTSGLTRVIKNTGLLGRWQIIQESPRIICDTGHNKAGITQILKQLNHEKYAQLHMVFGTVNDKNITDILALLPTHAHYYFTKANIPRALNPEILQATGKKFGINSSTYVDVKSAFKQALSNAKADDLIFIGGSTFVVADFLA